MKLPKRSLLTGLALLGLTALGLGFACDSSRTTDQEQIGIAPERDKSALELVFGIYTSDAATEMVKQFSPALSALEIALSRQLGEPVRVQLKVSSTYTGGVKELVDGRVDFARMGPASYVMAKEMNPGIQIIAMESKKGKKTFKGVICVHEDSPIQNLAELEGERFAFGNSQSTIGRFLAQQILLENGIGANELGGFDYLGRHDKVGMAVASQMYVAGALKQGTFKKLIKAGEPIRVIATFPNVTKPWIARADLDPRVFGAIQEALFSMEDQESLTALNKDGFLPGEDGDYDSIRTAIEASRSFGG